MPPAPADSPSKADPPGRPLSLTESLYVLALLGLGSLAVALVALAPIYLS